MRSNAGHSMVEAKMLDFQVLVFVTSFWLQPTRSKAGLLLQVFQIGASDTHNGPVKPRHAIRLPLGSGNQSLATPP